VKERKKGQGSAWEGREELHQGEEAASRSAIKINVTIRFEDSRVSEAKMRPPYNDHNDGHLVHKERGKSKECGSKEGKGTEERSTELPKEVKETNKEPHNLHHGLV